MTGTTAKPDEVRKATSDGMQRIYLIIVGFAITQGLVRALSTKEGEFFGLEPYEDAYGVQTLLLLAFLFTIIRFAHGSVLHLTALTSHKKWQWDMMGLMAQAILFFVVALSVKRTDQFICVLGAVICWDSIWLVRHVWMGISSAMEKQWLTSNIIFIVVLIVIELLRSKGCVADFTTGILALLVSVILGMWDYRTNSGYYFPRPDET